MLRHKVGCSLNTLTQQASLEKIEVLAEDESSPPMVAIRP